MLNFKKTPLINDSYGEDEVIEIHQAPPWIAQKRSTSALVFMSITAVLVAIAGITSGLVLYRQYLKSNAVHRYKGFCSIPVDIRQMMESDLRMPLRWSQEPDVQVVSVLGDGATNQLLDALREELDIDEEVEDIAVTENGRQINFIHDFNNNVSGIVDEERCFMMDLDPESVLPPAMLVVGLQQGDEFDVSPLRTTLHAILPALHDMDRLARVLAERCAEKPTYQLQREAGIIIRKRSADAPAHDYIHFAGKHVQEIEIANINDLLHYEQQRRNKSAILN